MRSERKKVPLRELFTGQAVQTKNAHTASQVRYTAVPHCKGIASGPFLRPCVKEVNRELALFPKADILLPDFEEDIHGT